MKKISLLIVFFTLQSCDWFGDYKYTIQNNTQKDLQVKFSCDCPNEIDTLIIPPTQNKLIRSTISGNLGKYEDPDDIYTDSLKELGNLRIYYNGNRINKNFKLRSFWSYNITGEREGTYSLNVNDSI